MQHQPPTTQQVTGDSQSGTRVVAGYLMGTVASRAGWVTAGGILISMVCVVAAVLALALRPRQMSL